MNLVFPACSASKLKVFTAWLNFTSTNTKTQGPAKRKERVGYSQVSGAVNLPTTLAITKIRINQFNLRDFLVQPWIALPTSNIKSRKVVVREKMTAPVSLLVGLATSNGTP